MNGTDKQAIDKRLAALERSLAPAEPTFFEKVDALAAELKKLPPDQWQAYLEATREQRT